MSSIIAMVMLALIVHAFASGLFAEYASGVEQPFHNLAGKAAMSDPNLQQGIGRAAEEVKSMMTDPTLQRHAKQLAERVQTIVANPAFQMEAKRVAEQMEVMMTDPDLQQWARTLIDTSDATTPRTNFEEHARKAAEQLEAMMATPNIQARMQDIAAHTQILEADLDLREQMQLVAEQMEAMMMKPNLKMQDQAKLIGEQLEAMTTDPKLQEQAKIIAKQVEAIMADSKLSDYAKLFVEQAEAMMNDPKLHELAKRFVKQMQEAMSPSHLQLQEQFNIIDKQLKLIGEHVAAMLSDPELQEHAKFIAEEMHDMITDTRFQEQVRLFVEQMKMMMPDQNLQEAAELLTKSIQAKMTNTKIQEHMKLMARRVEHMMDNLELQAQVKHVGEHLEAMMANLKLTSSSIDTLVRAWFHQGRNFDEEGHVRFNDDTGSSEVHRSTTNLVGNLFGRALKASPLRRANLDKTSVGKPEHFSVIGQPRRLKVMGQARLQNLKRTPSTLLSQLRPTKTGHPWMCRWYPRACQGVGLAKRMTLKAQGKDGALVPQGGAGNEGASLEQSTFNLLKNVLGAGVLSLPYGMAGGTGLIPAVVIAVTLGVYSGYTFLLIARNCEKTGCQTFSALGEKAQGEAAAKTLDITCTAKCFATCLAYSLVIADSFAKLAITFGLPAFWASRNVVLATMTVGTLLPLCLLRDLSALAPASLLGCFGMFYTTGFMVFRYFEGSYAVGGKFFQELAIKPSFGPSGVDFASVSIQTLVLTASLAAAFIAHYNAPTFYDGLENRSVDRFKLATMAAYMGTICVCITVMVSGYMTFGTTCQGNILNCYSPTDVLATVARVAVGVAIVLTYPLPFRGLRNGAMSLLKVGEEKFNEATVALLGAITLLGFAVTNVGFVNNFGGAFLGAFLIYIAPSLLGLRTGTVKDFEAKFANFSVGLGIMLALLGGSVACVLEFAPHMLAGGAKINIMTAFGGAFGELFKHLGTLGDPIGITIYTLVFSAMFWVPRRQK
eukprot:gnl/TRDRNA2_/TRDRNA2_170895_c2_seq4.p1 gnl/TRDRNA2_/TRDRNA2_170895_c2~~gnl/TRDRNA2_/TRDRNA2_170895_c2_seq4.p1  ORF type:complete len:1003 (-),score=187.45 gnl/TRDRNA2_/TRDRNA2_170895_c2_seq4:400-3408(-)